MTIRSYRRRCIGVFQLVFLLGLFLVGLSGEIRAAEGLSGQLNIASAQVDEFTLLPGIGPKKAEAIVAYRAEHPFTKVEDLLEVKGVGPKMFENIKAYVKLEGESDLKGSKVKSSGQSEDQAAL